MVYIIKREMGSERRERLFGRVSRSSRLIQTVSGHARNVEEAADVGRELEHTAEGFTKPLVVQGGRERRQAFEDDMQRLGRDPDEVDRQWHGPDGPEADRKRYGGGL